MPLTCQNKPLWETFSDHHYSVLEALEPKICDSVVSLWLKDKVQNDFQNIFIIVVDVVIVNRVHGGE